MKQLYFISDTEKDVEKGVALWNVWSRSRNSSTCLDKSSTSRLRKNEEVRGWLIYFHFMCKPPKLVSLTN